MNTETQQSTEHSQQPTGIAAGAAALGLDGKLLAAQIVNFIILVILLRQFVYKPLLSLLEKRRLTIEESLAKASSIEKEFNKFRVEQDERLAQSKKEAAELIAEAKKAAEVQRAALLDEAKAQTESMMKRAEESILKQKQSLADELKQEVGMLVVKVTEKVIGKHLSADDQKRLLEEALKEVK